MHLRSLVSTFAAALLLPAALACQPEPAPEHAHGHADSELRQSAAEIRELPSRNGYRHVPVVVAEDQASRVAFFVTLANDEADLGGALQARGRTSGGVVGEWQDVEVTFAEENLRVARAELDLLADEVEVRVTDGLAEDVADLTYAAVLVSEEEPADAIALEETGSEQQGLDADLAAAGVISREAWGARPSGNCVYESGKSRMAIHHSASARRSSGTHIAMVRALQSYSKDGKGYCELDYHFLVTDDGRIWEGRPLHFRGSHSGGYNTNNIGIVLVGCFDGVSYCDGKGGREPPAAMIAGAASAVRALSQKYGIPINEERIKGHGQQPYQQTSCPGSYMIPQLGAVRWLAAAPTAAPVAPSTHVIFDVGGYLPTGAGYAPVAPERLLDTRSSNATHTGTLAHEQTITFAVTGRAGVPATGVSAVVLNLTVTQPTAPGFFSLFPSGAAFPGTSNLNFASNQTTANLVIVKPGSDGKIHLRHAGGTAHAVVDVFGYFSSSSGFTSLTPARVVDTRGGSGLTGKLLGDTNIKLSGTAGVPSSGVGAVVVNLTVTQPEAAGFATFYEKGRARPNTSNLNFVAGQTKANLVIVPLSSDGYATLWSMQRAHYVIDVYGWFPDGASFRPLDATRLLDTRNNNDPVDNGAVVNLQVTGTGGVPSSGVAAVLGNLTVTQPTGPGFLQAYPAGGAVPPTSSLNYASGETVANAVIVTVGDGGRISLRAHVAP